MKEFAELKDVQIEDIVLLLENDIHYIFDKHRVKLVINRALISLFETIVKVAHKLYNF